MRVCGIAIVLVAACGDDSGEGQTTGTEATDAAVDSTILVPDTTVAPTETATPTETVEPVDTVHIEDIPDGEDVAIEPGTFGAPCDENSNCLSGYCVEGPEGFVCTRLCTSECPAGYDCKGVASRSDVAFLCLPRLDRLCAPCTEDLQCNGGKCLTIDGELRCGRPCARVEDCPSGFDCVPEGEDLNDGYCQPDTRSCSCFAEVDGGLRTCATSNDVGTCFGVSDCDPEVGWSACSAKTPTVETCNGTDDDCDAFVDEDLSEVGQSCEIAVPGVGSCDGQTVCAGVAGIQCQGATPEAETCDFADDDCDGQVDEDFKQGDVYATYEHCGTCNRSCAIGFPNAAQTACQVEQGVAQCVVVSCQQGYIKQNDFQCIPDVVNLCEPCSSDANCLGQGSACVTLPDGNFCAKACANNTECPLGFQCNEVGEASKQCVPTTGVCSCGPSTQGLSRACSLTVSPAGQPSYTCAGTETCGAAGWGACAMPTETCNNIDDDCDASTDEGFRNGSGKYDKVDNCGACGVSCLALDFPNSSPTCDASGAGLPRCDYQCDGAWVDVDEAPGCDCLPSSTTDLPDLNGTDANCDGIDGEIGKAIFVAKTGDDAGLGTIDDPLRTIQAGIAKATTQGKRDVLVATGVYEESVNLANNVSVYGGYSPDFREREVDVHETAILGATPTDALRGAVNASTTGTQTFDGFSVFGANNPVASGNSYAIYLRNAGAGLTISNNYVVGGDAGAGTTGAKGSDGANGTDGVIGQGSAIITPGGTACTAANQAAGGAGGARTCGGIDVSGGAGGTRVCPSVAGTVQSFQQTSQPIEHGIDGKNNSGTNGDGGEAGWDDRVQSASCNTVSSSNLHDSVGATGADGARGPNGAAGAACVATQGTVVGDQWMGTIAGAGGVAGHGGGGGGGGASGGIDHATASPNCSTVPFVVGGSGGGGGSGGCAGGAADSGTSGGGSFAIFVTYSAAPSALPSLRNNTLVRGRGGRGGDGGAGGVGGAPGFGGEGGARNRGILGSNVFPQDCCAQGGAAGGNGGIGGHGAGGGGGCGGASYSLYIAPIALAAPRTSISANTFADSGAGGVGGSGGTSLGNVGPNGGIGLKANTNY